MTAAAWQEGDAAAAARLYTKQYTEAPAASGRRYGLGREPVQTYWDQVERIVAIGDVHGDAGALIACLSMAQCIDEDENWCGGTTHVVQIGDILDRGDEERSCLDLLFRLKHQAAAAGGAVHVLMGNHEAMNVDRDFEYVGLGGFDGWESREETKGERSSLLGNVFASFTSVWPLGGLPGILKAQILKSTLCSAFCTVNLLGH